METRNRPVTWREKTCVTEVIKNINNKKANLGYRGLPVDEQHEKQMNKYAGDGAIYPMLFILFCQSAIFPFLFALFFLPLVKLALIST